MQAFEKDIDWQVRRLACEQAERQCASRGSHPEMDHLVPLDRPSGFPEGAPAFSVVYPT